MPTFPINKKKPYIFLTMGDPFGIGPEVIMKALASPEIRQLAVFIIIGDTRVMKKACDFALIDRKNLVAIRLEDAGKFLDDKKLNLIDPGESLKKIEPSECDIAGSKKALECLSLAVKLMRNYFEGVSKALVTAPLSKERVARISPGFTGHTEYLQKEYCSGQVTMVLVGKTFSVVPVTRHIPLKHVASNLTEDLILNTLNQVSKNRALICGKKDVRIGVCALNPHCGEGGNIGTEELDLISPAVEKAKKCYGNIMGPVSADTVFYKAFKKEIDIVVSMYHDQALAPFKMIEFNSGVNMTLGLGHVRTSPDHGTAFDIAGKGIADPKSMKEAISLAVRSALRLT